MLASSLFLALAATPPELALLSKHVDGSTLEVRWQRLDGTGPAEPFARLGVSRDETFHGIALPGTRSVAVVRVREDLRDPSFASVLSLVSPGKPERLLATDLVRASRPLLVGQRLFVERGHPGPEPRDGAIRVDALEIDEIDPSSGRRRTVFATNGYWTHLAGSLGAELVLYVAEPAGARLVAVHVDTLAVRTLKGSLPALAHDFVVDPASKSLLFAIAEPGVERWFLERLDLFTGRSARVAEGEVPALLATLLPGGIAWAPQPGGGLRFLGTDRQALPPGGPGFDRVALVVDDALIVGNHEAPGAVPVPFVRVARTGARLAVPFPPGKLVEFAGVLR